MCVLFFSRKNLIFKNNSVFATMIIPHLSWGRAMGVILRIDLPDSKDSDDCQKMVFFSLKKDS